MAAVEDLTFTNLTNLLNQGDALLKAFTPFTKENMSSEDRGALCPPVDIVSTPKEYIFYVDIPGHSKSDIQVLFVIILPMLDLIFARIELLWREL